MLDPFTVSRLALARQQEILEAAARDDSPSLRPLLRRVGYALIRVGEKLAGTPQSAFAAPVTDDGALCEPDPC